LRKKANKVDRYKLSILLLVQLGILVFISVRTGPAWDEWGHLPSGLYTLQFGDFSPYCVNPPLPRLVAASPVMFFGGEIDYVPLNKAVPGFRSEFPLAYSYVRQHGRDCFFWVSVARITLIPISLFGTVLVWSIGSRLGGVNTGLLAAWFWAFSPTVLTFGASITGDVSGAVFGLFASYRFYIWLRLGGYLDAILLGASIALAMLSKATWIILPPLMISITIVYLIRVGERKWTKRTLQFLVTCVIAWTAIHACYDFQGMLQPIGNFNFVSGTLGGERVDQGLADFGNRFDGTWWAAIPAPLPSEYVRGIDIQKRDFESDLYSSYLWGERRDRGWWYYYLLGMWLKEPLAIWVLAIVGCFQIVKCRHWPAKTNAVAQMILYLPGVAVLLFVSTQTGFTDHVRYVLPFFPCLFLMISMSLTRFSSKLRVAAVCLAIAYAVSSISVLPRSYAYFTYAVGGSSQGARYLQGSNLDWGQDLLALTQWADEKPEPQPVYILYSIPLFEFGGNGSTDFEFIDGRPWITELGPSKSGYWAVFTQCLLNDRYAWFRDRTPDLQLSVSVQIYYVSEEDIASLKTRNTSDIE
jgi:hypothetical protein